MPFSLPHPAPLQSGRLLARWDRFIAEVALDKGGQTVRAHCVNPGRMEGLVEAGRRVWLLPAPDTPAGRKRKLRYTLELIEDRAPTGEMVITGANTQAPNRFVAAALAAKAIDGLRRYSGLRAEVRDGSSRIDFLLEGKTPHFVEVKNSHIHYPDGRSYFPDTVSDRAAGHMRHLAHRAKDARCTVLFVVQRPGKVRSLRPSRLHDPTFAAACGEAAAAGVRFRAIQVLPDVEGYHLGPSIPVDLSDYDADAHIPWRDAGRVLAGWKRSPRRAKAKA